MDGGIGTALLVANAGLTAGGLYASRKQRKLDKSRINYEAAQAERSAADAAAETASQFRRSLSSQLAIGALRGAPGSSPIYQFTSASFANYARDQSAIKNRGDAAGIAATIARQNVRSEGLFRDIGLIGGFTKNIFQQTNLSGLLGRSPGGSNPNSKTSKSNSGGLY